MLGCNHKGAARGERKEEMNEDVTTVLNIFSKSGADVLADLVKEIQRNQYCALSLRSIHLFMSRNGSEEDGFTPCLKDYVEDENLIHYTQEAWYQVQRVLGSDKFWPTRRMRNRSIFIAGHDGEGSLLWAEKLLLLFV